MLNKDHCVRTTPLGSLTPSSVSGAEPSKSELSSHLPLLSSLIDSLEQPMRSKDELLRERTKVLLELTDLAGRLEKGKVPGELEKVLGDEENLRKVIEDLKDCVRERDLIISNQREFEAMLADAEKGRGYKSQGEEEHIEKRKTVGLKNTRASSPHLSATQPLNPSTSQPLNPSHTRPSLNQDIQVRLQQSLARNGEQTAEILDLISHLPRILARTQLQAAFDCRTYQLALIDKSLHALKLSKKVIKQSTQISDLQRSIGEKEDTVISMQKVLGLLITDQSGGRDRYAKITEKNDSQDLGPLGSRGKVGLSEQMPNRESVSRDEDPGNVFSRPFSTSREARRRSESRSSDQGELAKFGKPFLDSRDPPRRPGVEALRGGDVEGFRGSLLASRGDVRVANSIFTLKPESGLIGQSSQLKSHIGDSMSFNANPLDRHTKAKDEYSPFKSPLHRDYLKEFESPEHLISERIGPRPSACDLEASSEIGRYQSAKEVETLVIRSSSSLTKNDQIVNKWKEFPLQI